MFDQLLWHENAKAKMAQAVRTRELIRALEAQYAVELAEAVEACQWPDGVKEPDRADSYGVSHINEVAYGEDLVCELSVMNGSSNAAAETLVRDVEVLNRVFPKCWANVINGVGALWQARRVVEACLNMTDEQCSIVDAEVGKAMGAVGYRRWFNLLDAAVKQADPEATLRKTRVAERKVRVGSDPTDPGTGYIYASLDRSDTIRYDAHIHYIAEKLAAEGDPGTLEERLAKAAGLMCNPGAAVQFMGLPSTRGMNPELQTDQEKQAFIDAVAGMVPGFTPKTQVYLHVHVENLFSHGGVCRLEKDGPALIDQIANITKGSNVSVTPVIHVDDYFETSVDAYHIPLKYREQVLLRAAYSRFPYSSVEYRNLDLDHVIPWHPKILGLTRPSNLAPLERRAHRMKTHCGWTLQQPSPDVNIWRTGAGQHIRVDHAGTHRIRPRE